MRTAAPFLLWGLTSLLCAQRVGSPTGELDKLGVEELFGLQVTSVGRKAERLSKAPAAVFVLTSEDIRRSGASSIPEALRSVPGMTVLRVDGRSWVVSTRGSARLYSDKILVMIDGRSVFTPLFSGVIWDSIDVLMEDVERIEVVRGPGAVMWGPNAVNGVINVITKKAQATQGGLVTAHTGNEQRGGGSVRAGFAPNERVAYRVWGKGTYQKPAYHSPGQFHFIDSISVIDPAIENLDFGTLRAGFRVDGLSGKSDSWMAQGDVYRNDRQDPSAFGGIAPSSVRRFQAHTDYNGGYLQGRWIRSKSENDETIVQFTYDRTVSDYPFMSGTLNNATVDVQKRSVVGERHSIYWGAGYQQYWDDIQSRYFARFVPQRSVYRDGDVVARDEWELVPQRLMASAGIRLDYSSHGKLEYQPSVRVLYTPDVRQSLWFGASRAIRRPSRYDRDLHAENGTFDLGYALPIEVGFAGDKNMRSEVERSLEVGYRRQHGQSWSVDISGFWSRYERLRLLEGPIVPLLTWGSQGPILVQPMHETNAGSGRSYGGEAWAYLQLRPTWRLTPEYSYLNESRWMPPAVTSQFAWDGRPSTFRHQGMLRSQHDLTADLQFDITLRARSRSQYWNSPGTVLLDARLGWRPFRTSEISFSGQNLTDRRILECVSEGPTPAIPIRRMFLVKWTQRF